MPGFRGPETGHQMKILERVEGTVADRGVSSFSTTQFGHTDVPIWEVDETGRIHSPATPLPSATSRPNRTASSRYVAERIHLERCRDQPPPAPGNSRRRERLLGWCDGHQRHDIPIVYDPGNDLPAHVWWAGRKGTILYVALNDPSLIAARVERAAAAFGLSPSQRRLTASIVAGEPLTDAAKREGIRISTARTQLQRIFDKVGVRTQPALVRALLAVTGPT